jgi:hypothetical protein
LFFVPRVVEFNLFRCSRKTTVKTNNTLCIQQKSKVIHLLLCGNHWISAYILNVLVRKTYRGTSISWVLNYNFIYSQIKNFLRRCSKHPSALLYILMKYHIISKHTNHLWTFIYCLLQIFCTVLSIKGYYYYLLRQRQNDNKEIQKQWRRYVQPKFSFYSTYE